jgi:hypothetical protein
MPNRPSVTEDRQAPCAPSAIALTAWNTWHACFRSLRRGSRPPVPSAAIAPDTDPRCRGGVLRVASPGVRQQRCLVRLLHQVQLRARPGHGSHRLFRCGRDSARPGPSGTSFGCDAGWVGTWLGALVIIGHLGGMAFLGVALSAAAAAQLAPSVWAAYRTRTPTGVSLGTWLLVLGR